MAKYRITVAKAKIRSAPENDDSNIIGELSNGNEFEGTLLSDKSFIEITPANPGDPKTYTFEDNASEVIDPTLPMDPLPLPKADHFAFCVAVTDAARRFGPDRDYLMAIAYCGSDNLKNLGSKTTSTVGPFHFTAEEWRLGISRAAVEKSLPPFGPLDRYDWRKQPVVAALMESDRSRALSKLLSPNPDGSLRYPNSVQLYFARKFGEGAEKLLEGDDGRKCSATITGAPTAGSYADELKKGESTIKEVLDELREKLVKASEEAQKVVDTLPLGLRYFRDEDIEAPWMRVALGEMAREVVEIPGPPSNDRVVLYHRAAGLNAGDETAWCGSFVAYCMKECGVPEVAAKVPPAAASTLAWKAWGTKIADIQDGAIVGDTMKTAPIGSVVVLKGEPEHVGFLYAPPEGDTMQILGGNQGDKIKVSSFAIRNVARSVRWLDISAHIILGDGQPLLITGTQLKHIFPNCPNPELWASKISASWRQFGINTKSARAGFLGITGAETGYVQVKRENMNYDADRAAKVWPKDCSDGAGHPNAICRVKTALGPEGFANWIYAGKIGNGNEASGDGHRFRGGGLIQLTGRGNYAACAAGIGVQQLVDQPDIIVRPDVSALAAAWYIVQFAKILSELDIDNEDRYLAATLKVGKLPDDDARKRRLSFRKTAFDTLA